MKVIRRKERFGRPRLGQIAEATQCISLRLKASYIIFIEELLKCYSHYMREEISRTELIELLIKNEYQKTLFNKFNILGLEQMICKACELNGVKSTIEVTSKQDLCVRPYYDEEGQYHIHDPYLLGEAYKCSKGHEWKSEGTKYVCWCGWGKDV